MTFKAVNYKWFSSAFVVRKIAYQQLFYRIHQLRTCEVVNLWTAQPQA